MFEYVSDQEEEEEEKGIMEFEGNSLLSGKDQWVVGGEIKPVPIYFLSFWNFYQ